MRFTIVIALTLLIGTANAAVVSTGYELQKAIYSAVPGEVIYLKAGYYAPPTGYYFDVNRSVTIEAYGDGEVIIDATGKYGGFDVRASDVTIDGLGAMTIRGGTYCGVKLDGDLSNVAIRGLTIDCAGNTAYGIFRSGANVTGLTISDVKILDPTNTGIYLADVYTNRYLKNVILNDVEVTKTKYGKGLYISVVGTDSRDISIVNSKFTNCGSDGLYLTGVKGSIEIVNVNSSYNGGWGIYVSSLSDPVLVFQSNVIKHNKYGVYISGVVCDDLPLLGLEYNGGNYYVVDLNGRFKNVIISGLIADYNVRSFSSGGIRLAGSFGNVTITDSYIDCAGTASYGIYRSGANISGLTVSNVKILDSINTGIYLADVYTNRYLKNVFIDEVSVKNAGKGIYITTPGTNSENVSLLNSEFTNCAGDGIYLAGVKGSIVLIGVNSSYNGGWGVYISGSNDPELIFHDNTIMHNGYGVHIYDVNCNDLALMDLEYNGGYYYVVDLNGKFKNVTINGLVADYNVKSFSSGGIKLVGEFSNVTITNGYIDCGGSAVYGIYRSGANISELVISNVRILNPTNVGIYLSDVYTNRYLKEVIIDNVTIMNTKYGRGIYVSTPGKDSKNITIIDSKVIDCSSEGIYLTGVKGNVSVVRTIVTDNPTGIYVAGESIVFVSDYIAGNDVGAKIYTPEFFAKGNAIKNNAHYGLYISGSGTAEIFNSEFDNNGNGGYTDGAAIYLTGGRSAEIHNCNLLISNNHTIYNSQTTDVNAQCNYWGTTDTNLIGDSIYDGSDVSYYGTVYYLPLLTSPSQIVPPPVPELATMILTLTGIAAIILIKRKW